MKIRRYLPFAFVLILGLGLGLAFAQSGPNILKLISAPSGTAPQLAASGIDQNITINLVPKGSGCVRINGGACLGSGATPCAFSGRTTFTGTATTSAVTFGTPLTNATYAVVITTGDAGGTPPIVVPRYTSQATTGFTIEISSSPGAGNTIAATWIVSPTTCG